MILLHDLLNQTLAEPYCALSWHRLYNVWRVTKDELAKQQVIEQLNASPWEDLRPDSLRLTFLSGVTGDMRFFAKAASRVLTIEPPNHDRLAAYMSLSWAFALQNESSRARFVDALNDAQLPEQAALLARSATLLLPSDFTVRVPKNIERVAVVSPYLGDRFHTPSVMVANQCEVLVKEGRLVHIFSCQELLPPDMSLFFGSTHSVKLSPFDRQYWQSVLPPGVKLTISDMRYSMTERWCGMFPIIAEFDPDAILLVGLYSPLAAALYARRPMVGMNVHALPLLAPLDVWLSAEEMTTDKDLPEEWRNAFAAPRVHFHPYRIKPPQGPWSVTRSVLGLASEAIVWVTVGHRLESEINGPWAARMLELLKNEPQVIWLLVGGRGHCPKALEQAPSGRVLALAGRNDVGGILRLSDIYINPPRMGGGFSVIEAMAEGLPVLSFDNSDGGDKVGGFALAETDAFIECLMTLMSNPALRSEMGQRLRARFAQRFDLSVSGSSLIAAFENSATAAHERLTPVVS